MMEQERDLATGLASELHNSVENGLLDAQLVEDNLVLLSEGRTTLNLESSMHMSSVENQLQVGGLEEGGVLPPMEWVGIG